MQVRRQSAVMGDPVVRRVVARLGHDDRPVLSAIGDAVGADDDEHRPAATASLEVAETQADRDPSMTGREFAGWAHARLTDDDRPRRCRRRCRRSMPPRAWNGRSSTSWVAKRARSPTSPPGAARQQAEEARLLYVAITRAAREVHLHWARHRTIRGVRRTATRSPFLDGLRGRGRPRSPSPTRPRGTISSPRCAVGWARPAAADPLLAALQAWRAGRARAARTAPEVSWPTSRSGRSPPRRPQPATTGHHPGHRTRPRPPLRRRGPRHRAPERDAGVRIDLVQELTHPAISLCGRVHRRSPLPLVRKVAQGAGP